MRSAPVPAAAFPPTRLSLVAGIGAIAPEPRRATLERFATDYWRPLYTYLRLGRRIDPETAEDLLQGFFVQLIERDMLAQYDPSRARLRNYLRLLLDRWVSNQRRDQLRLKRGGRAQHLRLDFASAEHGLHELADPRVGTAEQILRQEWIRSLFELALADLRTDAQEHGRLVQFTVFERYDVIPAREGDRPTYEELASELTIAVTKVTNDLHAARRRFRSFLLERLAESCSSEQEWREEARELLGIDLA